MNWGIFLGAYFTLRTSMGDHKSPEQSSALDDPSACSYGLMCWCYIAACSPLLSPLKPRREHLANSMGTR